MSHNYLFDLYNLIDQRLQDVQARSPGPTDLEGKFREGQISALSELQSFLSERFDRKLPKRLLKQLTEKRAANR